MELFKNSELLFKRPTEKLLRYIKGIDSPCILVNLPGWLSPLLNQNVMISVSAKEKEIKPRVAVLDGGWKIPFLKCSMLAPPALLLTSPSAIWPSRDPCHSLASTPPLAGVTHFLTCFSATCPTGGPQATCSTWGDSFLAPRLPLSCCPFFAQAAAAARVSGLPSLGFLPPPQGQGGMVRPAVPARVQQRCLRPRSWGWKPGYLHGPMQQRKGVPT